MSPEAIRRILKSRWQPSAKEQADRIGRWQKWTQKKGAAAANINSFRERSTALRRYHLESFSRKLHQAKKDNVI
jgi:hypothetical protein